MKYITYGLETQISLQESIKHLLKYCTISDILDTLVEIIDEDEARYLSKMEPALSETDLFEEFCEDEIDDGRPSACARCQLNACEDTCPHIFKLLEYYNIKNEYRG